MEERLLLASNLIVDNVDPEYFQSGTWQSWSQGYGGSFRFAGAGGGSNTATWQATGLTTGDYDVRVTWIADPNRAPDAPFHIYDGANLLSTVRINQRSIPVGTVTNGSIFQTLGNYSISSGTLRVVLSNNNTTGFVIADAVQLVEIPPPDVDLSWTGGGLSNPQGGMGQTPFTIDRSYTIGGEAVTNSFSLTYFASNDSVFGNPDDQLIGSETISTAAGWSVGTHNGTSPALTLPSSTQFNVFVRLDAANTVRENSELNNVSASLTVIRVALAADGQNVAATEGLPTGQTPVATFQDLLGAKPVGEYSALISWGDGASAPGTILAQANGTFTVLGDHTFSQIGSYPLSVTIGHASGVNTVAQSTATVVDAPLAGGSATIDAVANVLFDGVVAQFTDANPNGQANEFQATIDWADGTTSAGFIQDNGQGGFEVVGQHVYASTGALSVQVQVASVHGSSVTIASPAQVQYRDLAWEGSGLSSPAIVEGQPTFTVERSYRSADAPIPGPFSVAYVASYDAEFGNEDDVVIGSETISAAAGMGTDGPNGTSPELTLPAGAAFHLFAHLDSGANIAESDEANNVSPALQIVRAALSATGQDVAASEGVATGPVVVAVFQDLAGPKDVSQYSATVAWGDGSSDAGTIVVEADGTFQVLGDHTYVSIASYPLDVTITHILGVTSDVHSVATVTDAPLAGSGAALDAVANVALDGVVAQFSDANPNGQASEFQANIDWGDGTTSAGVIAVNGSGGFDVRGQHTYAAPGTYAIRTDVSSIHGSTVSVASSARVVTLDLAWLGLSNLQLNDSDGTMTVDRAYQIGAEDLATDFVVAYVASVDSVFGNGDDVLIGQELILAPADKTAGNHTGSSPVLTRPALGDFYLFARLDSANAVAESNENNNTSSALHVVSTGLSVTAVDVQAHEGMATRRVGVAVFRGLANAKKASQYRAMINWGDGSSSEGKIKARGDGTFEVMGNHTYSTIGTFAIDVTVVHASGATGQARGTATVVDAPLRGHAATIEPVAGAPFQKAVARFKDGNPNGTAEQFTALIMWGDGTTTAGTIVATRAGEFKVMGTHTYAEAKTYEVHVHVMSRDGSEVEIDSKAKVRSLNRAIHKDQTKALSFWVQERGQKLIESFNGGAGATDLAAWLATTFPNLYGAGAGQSNLVGKTNADVMALVRHLAGTAGKGVEAQILTTALNVYATTASLGGSWARDEGFRVTKRGLGARSYDVERHGAAFGVKKGTTLNVYQLLLAANQQAEDGAVAQGNSRLRSHLCAVFTDVNKS